MLGTEGSDVTQGGTSLGFISPGEEGVATGLRGHSTFSAQLGPLDGSKHDEAGELGWGNAIGFKQSPVVCLEAEAGAPRNNFKSLAPFRTWGRDGEPLKKEPLKKLPTPMLADEPGQPCEAPHGAVLDATATPLTHQGQSALTRFARSRLPEAPASWKRKRHLNLARRLDQLQRQNLVAAPKPAPFTSMCHAVHGPWQSINEAFEPIDGNRSLVWEGASEAMGRARRVAQLDDGSVDRLFGRGRNGARKRSLA